MPTLATSLRVGPKTLANLRPTWVGKRGSRGAKLPWQGVWGMCPHKTLKRGEQPALATSLRVGPKTLANPRPTWVGKGGSRGRSPPGRGFGGVPPRNQKRGRVASINKPATSGTQNTGEPSANGGGQRGSRGAQPPGGGLWGVSPHETLKGGKLPPLTSQPRVGPKTLADPEPTGVGKGGVQGAQAPWRGAWGVSPHKTKRGGELPPLAHPPRVGPKTLASPQPTGVGKTGVQGGKAPMAGGCGGCPPTKPKEGASCPH